MLSIGEGKADRPDVAEHYDVGDVAHVQCTFLVGETPTSPDTVTVTVLAPDGTQSTPTASEVSVGVWAADVPLTAAGYWRYRFVGVGTAPGVESGILLVDPDPFGADWDVITRRQLCTLDDAKEYAGEPPEDTTYDSLFVRLIEDCSQAFYRYTRREFTPVAESAVERVFDLTEWERDHRRVAIGDLADTDGLVVSTAYQDGTAIETVAAQSIVALPRNRDVWEPITELWFPPNVTAPAQMVRRSVMSVTGNWGFPQVPHDVRQLALTQVAIWFSRDVAKFSGTFSLAEGRTIRPRTLDDAIRDGLDVGYRVVEVG